MTGTERPNHDGKWIFYDCECGKKTSYGINRFKDSKDWSIESCCGGCVSAADVLYCPYCGSKIEVKQ